MPVPVPVLGSPDSQHADGPEAREFVEGVLHLQNTQLSVSGGVRPQPPSLHQEAALIRWQHAGVCGPGR